MVTKKDCASFLPDALREFLQGAKKLAIAFSGGVDSRFLCHAARLCHCDILALHVSGPQISGRETAWAREWAQKKGVTYQELAYNSLAVDAVAHNTRLRCYHCKKNMLITLKKWLLETGETDRIICDGANTDDQRVWRPGSRAAQEEGVISPLALAGMGKADIRRIGAETGLDWPEQPSRPCLLTRFAYETPINPDLLRHIDSLEADIADILIKAETPVDFRLRFLPGPELHITRAPCELEAELRASLAKNGLPDCPIKVMPDLSGFFDKLDTKKKKTEP